MFKRIAAALTVGALAMLLAACLLTPGKFVSTLDLRKDGQFSFTYKGEISMLGLAQLAAMGKKDSKFEEQPCFEDKSASSPKKKKETEPENETIAPAERPCTAAELAEQKSAWETDNAAATEKEKKELAEMKQAFGGLDPTDPRSIEDFATRLRRQVGWRNVTYKGSGLFDVAFAASGRLDHDFIFPVIEKFPTANTFVQVLRRVDGTVRVDAPGFAASNDSNPFQQMMGMGGLGKMGKDDMPAPTPMDGTFSLTTNGQILANNTDEGPKPDPAGLRLDWKVNARSFAGPTALVMLN